MKKRTFVAALVAGLLLAGTGPIAHAFNQAPPIGPSNGNAVLYTVNPDGSITSSFDGTTGNPYDGFDDVTVGIQNLSQKPVSQITLTGPNIFGFDGDGQAVFPGGTSFGPNTYQGPNNTFVINNANSGTVAFTKPLQPLIPTRGPDTTWWSMEGIPNTLLINNIAIDEFGTGFNTLKPGPNSGTLRPDPSGGLATNVLVYDLPFPGLAGDVLIHDSATTAAVSDIVRFDGKGHAIFYSDPNDGDPGVPPPADTGLPTTLLDNKFNVTEVSDPTNPSTDFVGYIPTPNQPGFDSSSPTYTFTSDVPEPALPSLLVIGATGVLVRRRRD